MSDNKIKLEIIRIGFMGDTTVGKTSIIDCILGQVFTKDMMATIHNID